MVAPTPTAAPLTAATRGFSHRARVWRNLMIGSARPPALAIATKSLRSLPAQKTSGAPAITTHLTVSALFASSIAAAIASYMARVSAFFFSGRFIRIFRTGPSLLMKISGIDVPKCRTNESEIGWLRRHQRPRHMDNKEHRHGKELL